MKTERRSGPLRLLAAVAFGWLLLPGAARAQSPYSFAVGAGGSLVNDTGTAANVRGFGNVGADLFAEMTLERWTVLQARVSRFGLPGSAPNTPNLRADAATLTVAYYIREEWWRVGVYAGAGGYVVKPNDQEAGQVAADEKETVFGWTGGLITAFDLSSRWDLRLEAAGHLIRTAASHKPIFITAGVAYHF